MTKIKQTTAFEHKTVAREIASLLLEINAVHVRPDQPFTLTSGLMSPVYIDCRKIISFPAARRQIIGHACAYLCKETGEVDIIAGGETAGIPFAAWLAERLQAPMIYVRKKPKGFGRDAAIEGTFADGARVLLVEDLATDGGSKLAFGQTLKKAGADPRYAFAIFYYDIFPNVPERLAQVGMKLGYLCTWWDVLTSLRTRGKHSNQDIDTIESFLREPLAWSAHHGGIASLNR
ncbi:MAG: orotate phosphoribosyltransferase [Pseudomonadota bacterium]